jgi:hypothetical protein
VPGRQEECACQGGAVAVQVCRQDGSGFLPCLCADVGAPADTPSTPADTANWTDSAATEVSSLPPGDSSPALDGAAPADTSPSPACEPCGVGPVKGVVCAPSQQKFVYGATVTLDVIGCDGLPQHLETKSKADGSYFFPAVPCGDHRVYVKAGSFATDYLIRVEPEVGTDVSGAAQKQCFKAQGVSIAVFWGQWDQQEDLIEALGFDYTFFGYKDEYFSEVPAKDIEAVQVLRDPARLGAFQILFFNCASAPLSWVHQFPEIGQNLRDFVLAGGSIYASDLAWAYVEDAFPDAIDFYGTDDLPTAPMANDGPQHADGNQEAPATIVDPDLATAVGQSVFTAKYGSGPLILVSGPGAGTTEHVRGPVKTDEPVGPFQPKKIVAGPMVLSFRPTSTSGAVVYTTFHNDEQADDLMRAILEYLVFQL